ncbi:MAG: CoA synthetase [Armatimonadetes bacterium]|nr:CoA synthetase [Armatimonadota bacterium]
MSSPHYTPEELMAVLISREVRDGERVGVGTLSPAVAAGCILAHHTHAPNATLAIWRFQEYWPFTEGMKEMFDLGQRGKVDLFFLSGAQIDQFGNTNLVAIGDYDRPKVRLPGGAGSGTLSYTVPRIILFQTSHSRRAFVEKVDFITATNDPPPNVYRRGKFNRCITPLAVLNFEGERPVLEAVNPGVTVQQVVENTGFPLVIPAPVPETPPPTDEELCVLRTVVKEKVQTVYPQFAAAAFRNED